MRNLELQVAKCELNSCVGSLIGDSFNLMYIFNSECLRLT